MLDSLSRFTSGLDTLRIHLDQTVTDELVGWETAESVAGPQARTRKDRLGATS